MIKTPNPAMREERLSKFNWAALLLGPLWALAHGLDRWALLLFIPFVNVIPAIYMGFHGNRLAFEKHPHLSVDEFLIIQKKWLDAVITLFIIAMVMWILGISSEIFLWF